ncbi:MAG: excinuclease ABC subunit UvrC [Bacteroidetes bacterium]|nr:excinuclease ABC subunit UvrC [Bacteroidota bacterium]MBU1422314.1 excinuclease ABC subunit UvrC [Bacteroidota bacterium]MBU2636463.1 excinuclease ABC subunit UvrC [Bacteroidota bacterium]
MQEKSDIIIRIDKKDIALDEKLSNFPNTPGVYQFKNINGKIIYVGKAKNLRNRVRQYFHKSRSLDAKTETLVSKVTDVEIIVTDSEVEALILEAVLIKKLKPRYNVFLRDDKSFPYIVITNEPYPRIFVTRRIIHDGSKYFGPYTDVKNLRSSLKMVREIFKVRSCNYHLDEESIRKRKYKICLDYHIKKCEGPCEGLVSQEHYLRMIKEVEQVLRGKTDSLISQLAQEMDEHSDALRFEAAAAVRDKITGLRNYSERQKIVDADLLDRDIFSVTFEDDDACGVIFKIRDGKMVGRQHYYLSGVEGKEEPEIVSQLVRSYYLEADYFPKEILLPCLFEDSDVIQDWLTSKRKEKVSIIVPKIGDKAKLMGMCKANARYLLDDLKVQKLKRGERLPKVLELLQKDLHLPNLPRRIECFDISNIQGADAVASLVVFEDGKPKKSDYRKFKIKTVEGPDDFASMKEVINRHYTKVVEENKPLPELIIVDGGKGQLSSAVEVITGLSKRISNPPDRRAGIEHPTRLNNGQASNDELKKISIIGLAKRLEEVHFPGVTDPQSIPKTSSSLKLLQRIRDEAHRFAVEYHRKLRTKRTLLTELDLIKGVGKKRSKELLEAFGSVQGVKFATSEQLVEIVGEKVAEKIKEYFQE